MLLTTELLFQGPRAVVLGKESSAELFESPQPRQGRLYLSLASSWEVLREVDGGAVTSLGVWLPVAVKSQAKWKSKNRMGQAGFLQFPQSLSLPLCNQQDTSCLVDEKASQKKTTSVSTAPEAALEPRGVARRPSGPRKSLLESGV